MQTLITVPINLTTTIGAYSANDVIGGLINLNVGKFYSFLTLSQLLIIDKDNLLENYQVFIFNSEATAFADADSILEPVAGRGGRIEGDVKMTRLNGVELRSSVQG